MQDMSEKLSTSDEIDLKDLREKYNFLQPSQSVVQTEIEQGICSPLFDK